MSPRLIAVVSAGLGLLGVLTILLTWTDALEWDHAESAGAVLVALSLFLLGVSVLMSLSRLRQDMALVRERTSSIAQNVNRTADRVEDIRKELFLGTYSHVPGQVSRIEGAIVAPEQLPGSTRAPSGAKPTPNTVFDRIYVLNLAADTDKLATTTATLTAFGIDFERFDAVDGAAPEFDDEWQAYQESDLSLPQEHHLNEHLLESRGAWGYLKTMRALLVEAKEEGLSNVLVLEDDVLVHRDFSSLFARSWSEVPSNWKVVYLGSVQAAADRSERVSDHLYNPGAMANGSYAVAIDSSVFDHLIGVIDRLDMPFDSGALREIDVAHAAQVFAMDPPVIIADVSQSTIRDGRSLEAHADKHGWHLDDFTGTAT